MRENWNIALYIGLGMWTLAALLVVRVLRLHKKGLLVRGQVLRHEERFGPLTLMVIRISSPLAGEMECRIRADANLPRFQVGQSTWVRYDPEKPEGLGSSIDQLLLPPFMAAFFGSLPMILYVAKALGH